MIASNISVRVDVDSEKFDLVTGFKIRIFKGRHPLLLEDVWMVFHVSGSMMCGLIVDNYYDHPTAIAAADRHIRLHRDHPEMFTL